MGHIITHAIIDTKHTHLAFWYANGSHRNDGGRQPNIIWNATTHLPETK